MIYNKVIFRKCINKGQFSKKKTTHALCFYLVNHNLILPLWASKIYTNNYFCFLLDLFKPQTHAAVEDGEQTSLNYFNLLQHNEGEWNSVYGAHSVERFQHYNVGNAREEQSNKLLTVWRIVFVILFQSFPALW